MKNAPTRFGKTSYTIHSQLKQQFIEAAIDPPDGAAPKHLVLPLRHPEGQSIRGVTVNGQAHQDFEAAAGSIKLEPSAKPIKVRVED